MWVNERCEALTTRDRRTDWRVGCLRLTHVDERGGQVPVAAGASALGRQEAADRVAAE